MHTLSRYKTKGEKEKMSQIILGIICFVVGYACGIGTIVLMEQLIKSKFGEEGAKAIVKK